MSYLNVLAYYEAKYRLKARRGNRVDKIIPRGYPVGLPIFGEVLEGGNTPSNKKLKECNLEKIVIFPRLQSGGRGVKGKLHTSQSLDIIVCSDTKIEILQKNASKRETEQINAELNKFGVEITD